MSYPDPSVNNEYGYSNMEFERDRREMPPPPSQQQQQHHLSLPPQQQQQQQHQLSPPPQQLSPPPLPIIPASVQFPILYKVITEEETKKDQDINGNVVSPTSSSSTTYNNNRPQRYPHTKTGADIGGSSANPTDRRNSNGNVVMKEESVRQYKQELSSNSVLHVPTWLFYFRNEYLVGKNPIFQDEEVKPEAEDPTLNSKVSFWFGDICNLEVDAIVNSTTSHFDGINGVDLAIHYSAGPELSQKCRQLAPCGIGDIRVTEGFKLPAKYVIHTVAPTDNDPASLKSCYTRSLIFLRQHGLRTIAFPCIGTGYKGFPRVDAARVALSSVRVFLELEKHSIDRIVFCVHNKPNTQIYLRFLQTYFPSTL